MHFQLRYLDELIACFESDYRKAESMADLVLRHSGNVGDGDWNAQIWREKAQAYLAAVEYLKMKKNDVINTLQQEGFKE